MLTAGEGETGRPASNRPLLSRRTLLSTAAATALAALGVSACGRPAAQRAAPTAAPLAAPPPELQAWTTEARAMLSDTLTTLQTFEVLHALRVSNTPGSGMRQAFELAWDPPTGAAWDEATHVTRGLHGRADQLFQAVTMSSIDPNLWREQRQLADATHDLLDLAHALGAYRDRIDLLPPGDGSSAIGLLDKAWAQWDAAAARWGVSRSEPIGCGKPTP
jgi:hypothetical protein